MSVGPAAFSFLCEEALQAQIPTLNRERARAASKSRARRCQSCTCSSAADLSTKYITCQLLELGSWGEGNHQRVEETLRHKENLSVCLLSAACFISSSGADSTDEAKDAVILSDCFWGEHHQGWKCLIQREPCISRPFFQGHSAVFGGVEGAGTAWIRYFPPGAISFALRKEISCLGKPGKLDLEKGTLHL